MLVVDRSVFSQLQADHSGIDFLELSASLIRAQRRPPTGSTPSILDSDTTSKGLSPTSLGFSPPSYEEIFGTDKHADLPPSYSEVSLLFRTFHRRMISEPPEHLEMCSVHHEDMMEINNENNINTELDDRNSTVHIAMIDEEDFDSSLNSCNDNAITNHCSVINESSL